MGAANCKCGQSFVMAVDYLNHKKTCTACESDFINGLKFKQGVKVLFGLEQQGHITKVEEMLKKYCSWDEINKAIGWAGDAAQQDYIRYLKRNSEQLQSRISELEQQLAAEREANRWIPVTESIPKEQGVYLVSFHNGVFGWFDCCELYFTPNLVFNNLIEHGATHWRKIQEVK